MGEHELIIELSPGFSQLSSSDFAEVPVSGAGTFKEYLGIFELDRYTRG